MQAAKARTHRTDLTDLTTSVHARLIEESLAIGPTGPKRAFDMRSRSFGENPLASNTRSCLDHTVANKRSPWESNVSSLALNFPYARQHAPAGAPYAPRRSQERPVLTLIPGIPQTAPSVYRRRRVVAFALALAIAVGLGIAVQAAATWAWSERPFQHPNSGAVAIPTQTVASHTWRVGAGDSLWGIVSATHPGEDPRPLVAQLAKDRGGADLKLGEIVTVP